MHDPFVDVPLNTKMIYVMGKTWSGCEVYLPVNSYSNAVQLDAKDKLHAFLASQPKPPPEAPKPRTA